MVQPLDLLGIKHLRGKHDQKRHGRRFGSVSGEDGGIFAKLERREIAALEKIVTDGEAARLHDNEIKLQLAEYLLELRGFSGTPKLVDKISKDRVEVYRGLSTDMRTTGVEYADKFKNGSYYYGEGIFGGGTYTAKDYTVAHSYSLGWGAATDGAVLTIGVNPKNVIDHGTLVRQTRDMGYAGDTVKKNAQNARFKQARDLWEHGNDADKARAEKMLEFQPDAQPHIRTRNYILTDPSLSALALGYGSTYVSDFDFYVVLDRKGLEVVR